MSLTVAILALLLAYAFIYSGLKHQSFLGQFKTAFGGGGAKR